jgi:signal transduction histidine kinase
MNILRSGKHPESFYKDMWKTLLKKRTFKGNFINKKKDGQIFVEEKIITSFINMNGEITNYISIGRDITNLRNLTKLGLRPETKVVIENETAGSLSLIQKQENDQKHLAKKIHEGLNQMLSAVRMNLESLNMSGSLKTNERKKVDFVSEVLSEIIQELRGISTSLSPASLYQFGLYSSVYQFINKLNKITTFKLNSNIEGLRFESDIEINYYRIIQEAVKNIITHSNATHAEINLFYSEKGLTLHVLDNGKGIDKRALKKTKMQKLGLLNIEERAKSINSRLLIRTRTKMGFEIILKTKTNPHHP